MPVITQFDWSVRGQYFPVLPARYCLCIETLVIAPIVTRKSYNKYIIAIPRVGQYGEIFRSLPRYHPSLQSGRYGQFLTEYIPVLPSQSCYISQRAAHNHIIVSDGIRKYCLGGTLDPFRNSLKYWDPC